MRLSCHGTTVYSESAEEKNQQQAASHNSAVHYSIRSLRTLKIKASSSFKCTIIDKREALHFTSLHFINGRRHHLWPQSPGVSAQRSAPLLELQLLQAAQQLALVHSGGGRRARVRLRAPPLVQRLLQLVQLPEQPGVFVLVVIVALVVVVPRTRPLLCDEHDGGQEAEHCHEKSSTRQRCHPIRSDLI